jgi:hypothetical protein
MLQHGHAGSSLVANAGNIVCTGTNCNATQCCTVTCNTATPAVVCDANHVCRRTQCAGSAWLYTGTAFMLRSLLAACAALVCGTDERNVAQSNVITVFPHGKHG